MEIKQNINPLTKTKSYQIQIEQNEDLNPLEIAECFKNQYPKSLALISYAKIVQIEIGFILVGLNLK